MSMGAAGNPTVAMMEAAFRHHGLAWRYVNMEVEPGALGEAVRGAKAMGFRGFNCSLPHKVTVIEPRGKTVVLFGAGGAARAFAVELGLAGVKRMTVVNRSEGRGAELVKLLREKLGMEAELVVWGGEYAIPEGTEMVINGTSVGLYAPEERLAVDVSTLVSGMVVADVVFSPVETAFLKEAAERGCVVLDGLGMLVNQGMVAVEYWTGVEPDGEVMRMALEAAMGV